MGINLCTYGASKCRKTEDFGRAAVAACPRKAAFAPDACNKYPGRATCIHLHVDGYKF